MLIICLRNITFIIIIIIAVITIRLDKENTLIITILAAYESCVPHDGRVTYSHVGRRRGGRLGPVQMQCGRQRGKNAVVKGVHKKVVKLSGYKSNLSILQHG